MPERRTAVPTAPDRWELFHNTLVDCGAAAGSASTDRGAFGRGPGSPALTVRLRDNLVVQLPGEPYVAPTGNPALFSGNHSLWHGNGAAPAGFTDDLVADPLFLDPYDGDYRLALGSPAIDSGTAAGAADDYRGVSRVVAQIDRGAFEHVGELFADSFESGATSRWSGTSPYGPAPERSRGDRRPG